MIGIAIIGSGAIAAVHADAFLSFADRCQVRVVCDLYPDKARSLIEKKGLSAVACDNLDEVLSRDDVDAVSVCLPPDAHASTVIRALNAGRHALVEKPMATSLWECDEMIRAAENSGKILSPIFQNRFKTPNHKVKTMLERGVGGSVRYASVDSLWWRGGNYYDIWWRGTWEKECGGCFTSHAVHQIDLLLWMLGKPQKVTAVIANMGHNNSECEDVGVAILEYPNKLVQLSASLLTHDEHQEMVFQTEKGRLSIPWKPAASKALTNGFPEEDSIARDELQKYYENLLPLSLEGHPAQIDNFLFAIEKNVLPGITAQEGRNVVELVMAIYKSSVTHGTVELPVAPDDPFYHRETMTSAMPRFYTKTRSVENFETSEITLGSDLGK